MDGEVLEKAYKERLEEKIISYLAESKNLDLPTAMDIYYQSKLADRIAAGEYWWDYFGGYVPPVPPTPTGRKLPLFFYLKRRPF